MLEGKKHEAKHFYFCSSWSLNLFPTFSEAYFLKIENDDGGIVAIKNEKSVLLSE